MSIKICHLTITSQDNIPRLLRESKGAVEHGMEVHIVALGNTEEKDGIHFWGAHMPTNRIDRLFKIGREIFHTAIAVDADIYQIHDPELLRFARLLKHKGKRVVFDSHENYTLQVSIKAYLPKAVAKLASRIYQRFETWALKYVDATLIPCTFDGKDIFKGRVRKHIILPNYPVLKEAGEYNPHKDSICYAGALSKERGISCLLQAASQSNTTLILAGKFSSEAYQKEVMQMPEWKSAEYLGVLPQDEIYKLYNKCIAGMSTMLPTGEYCVMDTLNTKVYEYMMQGLPVIVSDFPYARRVLSEYKCGICVDPTNVQDIVDAIRYFQDHPEKARQMGQNGRKAVEREFNWGTQEKILLKLYKELGDVI